jgi:hypothetical protein
VPGEIVWWQTYDVHRSLLVGARGLLEGCFTWGDGSKTTGNFILVVKAWSNFEAAVCEQLLLSPVVHRNVAVRVKSKSGHVRINVIQWKPLIMITLGLALFDNNNRLITLSVGYKNLHSLTQFIVTVQTFTCIKNSKIYLKNLCSVAWCLFAISSSWMNCSHS